jgi:hypothetical protein
MLVLLLMYNVDEPILQGLALPAPGVATGGFLK